MTKDFNNDHILKQRKKDLTRLARALFDSALHEENRKRLEMHRMVAVELAQLLDEAVNKDDILHTDLGLELLLFIELKQDGSDQAVYDQREVAEILDELEQTT
jgi:hypothetical protein